MTEAQRALETLADFDGELDDVEEYLYNDGFEAELITENLDTASGPSTIQYLRFDDDSIVESSFKVSFETIKEYYLEIEDLDMNLEGEEGVKLKGLEDVMTDRDNMRPDLDMEESVDSDISLQDITANKPEIKIARPGDGSM